MIEPCYVKYSTRCRQYVGLCVDWPTMRCYSTDPDQALKDIEALVERLDNGEAEKEANRLNPKCSES